MTSVQQQYQQKLASADEAAKSIKSGMHLVFPIGGGEPYLVPEALCRRATELEGVVIKQILPVRTQEYHTNPDLARHIAYDAWFIGGASRRQVNEGWATFTPNYFNELPRFIRDGLVQADVVIATVSPMDKHGYFSLSLGVDYTVAALEKASLVILEVNPNAPRTLGQCFVHISQVDYVVENTNSIPELKIPPLSETDEAIGRYVAELVENGSTLQIGFGGIPNAVTKFLLEKKDLGLHTEMITDGMVDLVYRGAVNNLKKTINPGKILGTFALGTKRLYDFLDDNPIVEMRPVDYVNNPYIIGQHDKFVSINATIEVDLLGQCNSESIGTRQYSGTGGQVDFVRGANLSRGGKAFITLASTAKNGTISKIVPCLQQGSVVTTGKNDVDYVVTEYGVAKLRGKTARERALSLIEIAHPDFRAELRDAAKKLALI
ncbi:MAG TPA: acetyl-CoA hydrolase/transferase C-terminal domain-containing protein [Verrucomicrobiae bacterium]|nr:acetyl-CoA hydrolase/transferase C-terminal domain-containing protein [Verrucomicrobiae bacterium]